MISLTMRRRGDQLAAVVSCSLSRHTVLCDLMNAQAGRLEHKQQEPLLSALRFSRTTPSQPDRLNLCRRRCIPDPETGISWGLTRPPGRGVYGTLNSDWDRHTGLSA
jgi:hypothetical protein